MSETKPQKRLVSKGQYVQVMGKIMGIHSLRIVTGFLGIGFGVSAILTFVLVIFDFFDNHFATYHHVGIMRNGGVSCMLCGCLSIALLWYSNFLFVKANVIEPVTAITDRNAHLLPPEDTLVRGSDLPPTVPSAELLRGTQAPQETPQEQLLRTVKE